MILAIVGLIHQLIQPGEALLVYAIMGIPVLFFGKIPKQINLALGIVGIIIGSIVGAKLLLTFPLMLLGLAFGQYRIFERCNAERKIWLITLVLSFIATTILSVYLWESTPEYGAVSFIEGTELTELQIESNRAFYQFVDLSLAFAPFFSVFYVSFLVVIDPLANKLLSPLNAFGRMAFTNYIGQSILLFLIAMLMTSEVIVSYTFATITCAIVVVFQVIVSSFWLKYFKYGPLEWIWRCGTYGTWLSIKR